MSEQFQPGDMVEAFRRGKFGRQDCASSGPPRGTLVFVSATCDFQGAQGIQFGDWPNPVCPQRGEGDYFWDATAYRRVYRPDPKLIERLTAEPVFAPPVPAREKVPTPQTGGSLALPLSHADRIAASETDERGGWFR